jgi:hypothetical protein
MSDPSHSNDPLAFVRNLWSGMGVSMPGMAVPTFDVDELDKRIKDMKAVEGWLRMNLSMLQMTIQGLEMQRSTLGAVQAMGQMAKDSARTMSSADAVAAAAEADKPPAGESAMWPWQMMQQMRERMQETADAAAQAVAAEAKKKPAARRPAGK